MHAKRVSRSVHAASLSFDLFNAQSEGRNATSAEMCAAVCSPLFAWSKSMP